MNRLALGLALTDEVEELCGHDRARVLSSLAAPLGNDICGAVGPLDALVSRRSPPGLDLLELLFIEGILGLARLLRFGQELEGVGWWQGRCGMRGRA